MYTGFKHLHSYFAYISLALLLIAIVYTAYCWMNNKPFVKRNRIIAMLGMVSTHIQLILGLVLYFISPLGLSNLSGETMKNSMARLYALEHPLTMIIAIVLITFGYSKAKRLIEDKRKYKTIVMFFSIGLFLILIRIPWNAWI